jgi:hypothetical protein
MKSDEGMQRRRPHRARARRSRQLAKLRKCLCQSNWPQPGAIAALICPIAAILQLRADAWLALPVYSNASPPDLCMKADSGLGEECLYFFLVVDQSDLN